MGRSSGAAVEIYTNLVQNGNGVSFARQALPLAGYDKNVVPVGITSEKGGYKIKGKYQDNLNLFFLGKS